jgi:hypothetical protein
MFSDVFQSIALYKSIWIVGLGSNVHAYNLIEPGAMVSDAGTSGAAI